MTERIHFLVIHPVMNDWLVTRRIRHRLHETIKPNDLDGFKNNDGRVISKKLKQKVHLQDYLKRNTYQYFESTTGKTGERDECVDGRYDSIDKLLWQWWRLRSNNMFQLENEEIRREDWFL